MRSYITTAFFFLLIGVVTGYYLGATDAYKKVTLNDVLKQAEEFGIKNPLEEKPDAGAARYSNTEYGFSFEYPAKPEEYVLVPNETPAEGERLWSATLFKKAEYEELIKSKVPREGPPTIAIDIFRNPQELAPRAWIESTSFSNFKLMKGEPATTTVAGADSIRYAWSGLYESESTVLGHKGNIIMLSVGFLAPEDAIRSDFETILRSFSFAAE